MNISSYIDAMSEKKFALSMPERRGLLGYLGKGEKGAPVRYVLPHREAVEKKMHCCLWAQGIIQCP